MIYQASQRLYINKSQPFTNR